MGASEHAPFDMADKDWRDTMQALSGAFSALGSVAIPVTLFVIGNRLSDRQRQDSDNQVVADRVEKMLSHLASDKPDERRLAVRVLAYFVSVKEFPPELLPPLSEIASRDGKEDVAAEATSVLEKVAAGPPSDPVVVQAKKELSSLPTRLNVHPLASDQGKASLALSDLSHGGVVVAQQSALPDSPAQTELRYYRPDDAAGAQQLAKQLQGLGVSTVVKEQNPAAQQTVRPKSYDLYVGKN